MAAINFFECFTGDVGLELHELNADVLKVYLSNAAPSASADTVIGDCADISAEHGYSAGGEDITNTFSEASGTGTLAATDVTFTAASGTIGPFRYAVVYNDTSPSDSLICWWDYGSEVTLQDTETFKVDFGANICTIAVA